jgi:hypothetical protein
MVFGVRDAGGVGGVGVGDVPRLPLGVCRQVLGWIWEGVASRLYIYIFIYIHMYVYMYIYTYMCTCIYIYIYMDMYMGGCGFEVVYMYI